MSLANNLIARIAALVAVINQRCEHSGCDQPATEYDAALDFRTCLAHQTDEAARPPVPAGLAIPDLRLPDRSRT